MEHHYLVLYRTHELSYLDEKTREEEKELIVKSVIRQHHWLNRDCISKIRVVVNPEIMIGKNVGTT